MLNKIIHAILLLAVFIYLLYGFDVNKIDISKFSILGIFATSMINFIAQIVLSIRWMKMSSLSFKISFETIVVSSALNMILPARLGELSKAIYLKKFYKYSYHKSLSIIFVERFFDVLVLFLLLCLWAYIYASNDIVKYSIIILSILIIFIILFFNSKKTVYFLKKIPFRFIRIYILKIYKTVNKIFKSPLSLSFYTILLWFMYFLSTALFFTYAIDFHLNLIMILELFLFSTIALAIPLAPGGVGTYEVAVVLFLGSHGVDKEDALMAATVYHILLFVTDFLLFYLLLYIKKIKFKELIKQ